MSELRKLVYEADSYPNSVQAVLLQKGDTMWVRATSDNPVYQVGDGYQVGNQRFEVSRIYYPPRHWWQFWEKKKPVGYLLRYTGGDTT